MELKYKYKIIKAIDKDEEMLIAYRVRWYYGKWFWQYEPREYDIIIPTCEHPEEGEISLFEGLLVRDLSNDMIRGIVETDLIKENGQDGVEIVARHRMAPLHRWSRQKVTEVEINEETGLTKERESSIMKLKEIWFGTEDKENNDE